MSEQQQTLTIQQAIDLAVQHHTAGRFPEAESIYQQILQSDPDQPVALHLLGVIAHQVGKNDIAVDLITKALAIKPDYAEAHNNLGNVLKELVRMDEALAHYHKAIAIKPDYAEAHNNLGNVLKELGRLKEAVASYQKALVVKPDFIEAYFNLGFAADLQEGNESFDPQLVLDKCFAEISLGNTSGATRLLQHLCLNTPYNTQQNVKVFVDRWCEEIVHLLDDRQFDIAGQRFKWLFTFVIVHQPFDALIQRYFDETGDQKPIATLEGHDKAVHLAMQSQYYYKSGHYVEADECAKRCLNETKYLLEDDAARADEWLLVQKSLKHIKNSENAREYLEQLIPSMD